MDAPTTPQEIRAAYKALYTATANAMDAQRQLTSVRAMSKDAEAVLTLTDAVKAGKNADERAALLYGFLAPERSELRKAEDVLAAAEREQALAKIAVNELRELLRLAELEVAGYYADRQRDYEMPNKD